MAARDAHVAKLDGPCHESHVKAVLCQQDIIQEARYITMVGVVIGFFAACAGLRLVPASHSSDGLACSLHVSGKQLPEMLSGQRHCRSFQTSCRLWRGLVGWHLRPAHAKGLDFLPLAGSSFGFCLSFCQHPVVTAGWGGSISGPPACDHVSFYP